MDSCIPNKNCITSRLISGVSLVICLLLAVLFAVFPVLAEAQLVGPALGFNTAPTWSADGNQILFLANIQAAIVNIGSSGSVKILSLGILGPCSPPYGSPGDGDEVLFSAPSGVGDSDIFLVSTATRGTYSPEPLFMSMSDEANPVWISESTIAYEVDGGIWKYSLTDRENSEIKEIGTSPVPSPNGSKLLYKQASKLMMIDLERNSLTYIGEGSEPAWSADSKKIAYVIYGDIFVAEISGDKVKKNRVTNSPNISEKSPTWSSDSKLLAFAANIRNNFDIWVRNLDEEEGVIHPATFGLEDELSPVFSPNENKIAYVRKIAMGSQIFVADYPPTLPPLPTNDPEDRLTAHDWPMIGRDAANTCHIPADDQVALTVNPTLNLEGSLQGIPRIYGFSIRDKFFTALMKINDKLTLIGGLFTGTYNVLNPTLRLPSLSQGRPFLNVWPCLYHNLIFAAAGGNVGNSFLTAFKKDGTLFWKEQVKGLIKYAIIAKYSHVFLVSTTSPGGLVHAYTYDGILRWSYPIDSLDGNWNIIGPPAVIDKQVFVPLKREFKDFLLWKEQYACLQIDASKGNFVSLSKSSSDLRPLIAGNKIDTVVPSARQTETDKYDIFMVGDGKTGTQSKLMKFRGQKVEERTISKMLKGHTVLAPASINARTARFSPETLETLGELSKPWALPRLKSAAIGNYLYTIGLGETVGNRLLTHLRAINLATGNEDFTYSPATEYNTIQEFFQAIQNLPVEPMIISGAGKLLVLFTDLGKNTTDLYVLESTDGVQLEPPNQVVIPDGVLEINNSFLFKSAKKIQPLVVEVLNNTILKYTWTVKYYDKIEQTLVTRATDVNIIEVSDKNQIPSYVNKIDVFRWPGNYTITLGLAYIDLDNETQTVLLDEQTFFVTDVSETADPNILYLPVKLEHDSIESGSESLVEATAISITRPAGSTLPACDGNWLDVTPSSEQFHSLPGSDAEIMQPSFLFPTPSTRYKIGLEVTFQETSWEPMSALFERKIDIYEWQEVGKDANGNPVLKYVYVRTDIEQGIFEVDGFWELVGEPRNAVEVQGRPTSPSRESVKIAEMIPHAGDISPPSKEWYFIRIMGPGKGENGYMECVIRDGFKSVFLAAEDRTAPEITSSQEFRDYGLTDNAFAGSEIIITCEVKDNHPANSIAEVLLCYQIIPENLVELVTGSDDISKTWAEYEVPMGTIDPAPNGFKSPPEGGRWEEQSHWVSDWQTYETTIRLPEAFKGEKIFKYYIKTIDSNGNVNEGDLQLREHLPPPNYGKSITDYGFISVTDHKKPNIKLMVFPESPAADLNYESLIFEVRSDGDLAPTDAMIPEGNAILTGDKTVTFSHDESEANEYYFPAFPEDTRFSFFLGVDDNVKYDDFGEIEPIRSCDFRVFDNNVKTDLRNFIPDTRIDEPIWDNLSVEDDPGKAYTNYTFRTGNDGRDPDTLRDPDKPIMGLEIEAFDDTGNSRVLRLELTIQEIQVKLRLLEQKIKTSYEQDKSAD